MRQLYQLCLITICSLATLMPTPAQAVAIAMDCCEDNCCEDTCCWKNYLPFIGGAVAGTAIAILACQDGHHKHHSSSTKCSPVEGPTGPTGAAGATGATGAAGSFTEDTGRSLTFNFRDVQFTPTPAAPTTGNGATILPFVVEPDGTVIESTVATRVAITSSPFLVPSLGTLQVVNPVFGEYHPGVQITFDTPSTFTSMIITLRADVTASRDNSTTTTLETDQNVSAFPATAAQVQVQTEFAYSPPPDVP